MPDQVRHDELLEVSFNRSAIMHRIKFFLILAALNFIPTLWFYSVGEEGLYTISSMEMWESKEWLIQTVYGVNQQRPPLLNWLVIGVSGLIGWSHVLVATRIVTIAATLGMVGWLYWLCKKLFHEPSFALFVSLACLTLLDLILYRGWLAYTDPVFSFFTFGAIATLWVATAERHKGWLFASVILVSCALLTKAITAYLFYATAVFVLLFNRPQRDFLLSPKAIFILSSIAIVPFIWLSSLPKLNAQGASLLYEIQLKLSAIDGTDYLARLFAYPLEAALRFAPVSLIALYLLFRKRDLQPETTKDQYQAGLFIALLSILPYWLAPQGGIRYLLPMYPIIALICARIIWRAGESARNLTMNWFAVVIAFKFVFVLLVAPYYQSHVRGENYVTAARDIMRKTAGYPIYVRDFRDVAESIVTQIDIDRYPLPTLKSPPDGWDNGFLLSENDDPSKGQLFEEIPLGGNRIYLLCRGSACQNPL